MTPFNDVSIFQELLAEEEDHIMKILDFFFWFRKKKMLSIQTLTNPDPEVTHLFTFFPKIILPFFVALESATIVSHIISPI
jgi:hypothetical protein